MAKVTTNQADPVSVHADSTTTWSNLGPTPTFNATTPLSVLYSLKFNSPGRSPQRLTHVHCEITLPERESKEVYRADENNRTPLPDVSLPALVELYLCGNIDACGMVLGKLVLPLTCTLYLNIMAGVINHRTKEWIMRNLDRVRNHAVRLPSIDARSRDGYRWHRYSEFTSHKILFALGCKNLDSPGDYRPQIGILYEESPGHSILPFDFILSLLEIDSWKFILDDDETNQFDDEVAAWLTGSHYDNSEGNIGAL